MLLASALMLLPLLRDQATQFGDRCVVSLCADLLCRPPAALLTENANCPECKRPRPSGPSSLPAARGVPAIAHAQHVPRLPKPGEL